MINFASASHRLAIRSYTEEERVVVVLHCVGEEGAEPGGEGEVEPRAEGQGVSGDVFPPAPDGGLVGPQFEVLGGGGELAVVLQQGHADYGRKRISGSNAEVLEFAGRKSTM